MKIGVYFVTFDFRGFRNLLLGNFWLTFNAVCLFSFIIFLNIFLLCFIAVKDKIISWQTFSKIKRIESGCVLDKPFKGIFKSAYTSFLCHVPKEMSSKELKWMSVIINFDYEFIDSDTANDMPNHLS